jgi:BirA family biotin operon repressor/biotin-[acetyl-CoA-carboxylase] ligase
MLTELYKMSESLLDQRDHMLDRYAQDCVTIGKEISVVRADQIRHGTAVGIDRQGALLVRFQEGHLEAVSSGEVSIRGMYGYVD